MSEIAVITGASSGIGYATVIALAERGVDSIATFHRNAKGIRDLERAVADLGRKVVILPLDLGNSAAFSDFRRDVRVALRHEWSAEQFQFLVDNAGVGQAAPFGETSEAMFDTLVRIILKGPYFLTQTLLPDLADGGAIVNVTSNAALPSGLSAGYSAYGSLKGGLAVLTRYMAKELAPRGIRVNGVAPGPTRTRLGDDGFEKYPELIPKLAAETALGRIGEAPDIGLAIASLLSADFRWATGEIVEVSGGFRL